MTAPELIRRIESLGGTLTLNGALIHAELTDEAKVLVPELRKIRDDVYRALQQRDHPQACPVHGAGGSCWNLADRTAVCGRCHPDPFDAANRVAAQSGHLDMPAGVRLLRWEPKQTPIAVTTFSVIIDTQKFIESTLQQLEAVLQGKSWVAGNWSVRDLLERLEQVGVTVEVIRENDHREVLRKA